MTFFKYLMGRSGVTLGLPRATILILPLAHGVTIGIEAVIFDVLFVLLIMYGFYFFFRKPKKA